MLSEKTVWIIWGSIIALVLGFAIYDVCAAGIKVGEVLGLVLFCAAIAWMAGLGEKYYSLNPWTNVAAGIAAAAGGAVLIFAW
jgi:hypothetical protein